MPFLMHYEAHCVCIRKLLVLGALGSSHSALGLALGTTQTPNIIMIISLRMKVIVTLIGGDQPAEAGEGEAQLSQ